MRNKTAGRVAAWLLCAVLLLARTAPLAFARVDPEDAFTVRITPPANASGESAAVEILVTDDAGDGFKSVQVKKGKNQTWQLMTSDMVKRENRYYGSTMITENCTVYVRVTDNSGKFYETSKYIECFGVGGTEQSASASYDPGESRSRTLTPDGAASVLDNASDADGKEFYTFTTPNENIFYLVIDKQKQDKNVYFLNAVTERDLLSLAQSDIDPAAVSAAVTPAASVTPEPRKDAECICTDKCVPGEVNADCPVCVLSWRNCKGEAHDHESGDVPATRTITGAGNGSIIILLIAVLGAGTVGYYLKIYKPRKELENAEDLDELTAEPEEETVNEDEPERSDDPSESEPDYPEYSDDPDAYGDGPESPEE